jgi:hypothetical protein
MWISGILPSNAMAAAAVKKIYTAPENIQESRQALAFYRSAFD